MNAVKDLCAQPGAEIFCLQAESRLPPGPEWRMILSMFPDETKAPGTRLETLLGELRLKGEDRLKK